MPEIGTPIAFKILSYEFDVFALMKQSFGW